jgi:hypothetical protein
MKHGLLPNAANNEASSTGAMKRDVAMNELNRRLWREVKYDESTPN